MRRSLSRRAAAAFLVIAGACDGARPRPADAETPTVARAASAMPTDTGILVTRAQFAELRWIEGRWSGRAAGGAPFFEAYRVVDDTTIASQTFTDSTFGTVSETGAIVLTRGRVETGSATMRWVVTAWSARSVSFGPLIGARNAFTWDRLSADAWRATLRFPAANGERRTVYEMQRVAAAPLPHADVVAIAETSLRTLFVDRERARSVLLWTDTPATSPTFGDATIRAAARVPLPGLADLGPGDTLRLGIPVERVGLAMLDAFFRANPTGWDSLFRRYAGTAGVVEVGQPRRLSPSADGAARADVWVGRACGEHCRTAWRLVLTRRTGGVWTTDSTLALPLPRV